MKRPPNPDGYPRRKQTFVGATVERFSPPIPGAPATLNVVLSFEEAHKLHLSIGQLLGQAPGPRVPLPRHLGGDLGREQSAWRTAGPSELQGPQHYRTMHRMAQRLPRCCHMLREACHELPRGGDPRHDPALPSHT